MPYDAENLSSNLEAEQIPMEFVDGHPICNKCLSGNHEHPITDEAREKMRGDCKNVGEIGGTQYQCHCGHGGWCIDREWKPWEEKE